MPSRKELRETLTTITHESFVSGVPLAKTSYKRLTFTCVKSAKSLSRVRLKQS